MKQRDGRAAAGEAPAAPSFDPATGDLLATWSAFRRRAPLGDLPPDLCREVSALGRRMTRCLQSGHKVLVFGNGGSAAIAVHLTAELIGRFRRDRAPLPAIALTSDLAAVTAIANDYGFEEVFRRQVGGLAGPGDVVVGMSTSGRSPNVWRALEEAERLGAHTVLMTGPAADVDPSAVDHLLAVPFGDTAVVQEAHLAIGHVVCEMIEAALADAEGPPAAQGPPAEDGLPAEPGPPPSTDATPGGVTGSPKVQSLESIIRLRQGWRRDGVQVCWTNGCFDVVHAGHVRVLSAARALGDVLVVGLNDDASVRALKGEDRPVHCFEDRAAVLAAMACVDWVVPLTDRTPTASLAQLMPEVVVKGADYGPGAKPMPEEETIRAYGGRIELVPLMEGRSTSAVVDAGRSGATPSAGDRSGVAPAAAGRSERDPR